MITYEIALSAIIVGELIGIAVGIGLILRSLDRIEKKIR